MAEVSLSDLQNAMLRSPVHRVYPVAPGDPVIRPKPLRVQAVMPDGSVHLLPVDSFGFGDDGMVLNVRLPEAENGEVAFPEADRLREPGNPIDPDWHVGVEREVVGFDGSTPLRMEVFRGSKESNPGVNNQ